MFNKQARCYGDQNNSSLNLRHTNDGVVDGWGYTQGFGANSVVTVNLHYPITLIAGSEYRFNFSLHHSGSANKQLRDWTYEIESI